MKILMVTPRYFPYIGGTETHVYEVGRRLVEQGVDVTLLTITPPGASSQLPREEMQQGMRILRINAVMPASDFFFAPKIYSIVANGDWDLVHCQSSHTFVPIFAMLAARKAKIPYIVTFHSGGHSSHLRFKLRNVQWRLLRSLLVSSEKLIGVSRFEADYFRALLQLPARHFTVIPNGMNQFIVPLQHDDNGAISQQCLIVSPGRLERYKGHQHMIRALPLIRAHYPTARLVILGSGPYEPSLNRLAHKMGVADHVEIRMIPPGNRHAMNELLIQASLISLLSEYEAHPVSIMEALSVKRPILVTHTSGMQELATQGLVRSVALHSSPGTIASAALEQIKNPLIPRHVTLPTWDDATLNIYDIYQQVIRRKQCVS